MNTNEEGAVTWLVFWSSPVNVKGKQMLPGSRARMSVVHVSHLNPPFNLNTFHNT